MIRTSLAVIIATLFIAIVVFQDRSERRVALVLSATSSSFQFTSKNFNTPTPDVALTLSKLGFVVIESIEPSREIMLSRIREFALALKEADVGLVYFSGKIAQTSGRSYLVPVGLKITSSRTIEKYGVPLDPLLHEMKRRNRHNFIFLNACRLVVHDKTDSKCHGLAPIGAGRNLLVMHANQAAGNKNSQIENEAVFVKSLTTNLMKRDVSFRHVIRNIYRDVNIATLARQVPWTENSYGKSFVFNKTKAIPFDKWTSAPPKVASIIPITLNYEVVKKNKASPKKLVEKKQVRMDHKTALRVIQKKLAAFSCYRGRIDGLWGPLSRKAASDFKKSIKAKKLDIKPGVELYTAVAEYEGPVCGKPCTQGRLNGKGRCVKLTRKELPFQPVILTAEKKIKKTTVKRKRRSLAKRYNRKKYYSKRYKKRNVKRHRYGKRRYLRKRYKRRYTKRKRVRVASSNLFDQFSD